MKAKHEVLGELARRLSQSLGRKLGVNEVGNALFVLWGDEKNLEWLFDVMEEEIDFDETYNLLLEFDFSVFENEVYTEAELIEDILLYQRKVQIKSKGIVWIIHRYDKDPFPSNPHAHQLGDNIKLDLRNGDCFRKREYLKTIHKKELLKIREQAVLKFKGDLPPIEV